MKNIMIQGASIEEFEHKIENIITTCMAQLEIREKEGFELLTRQQTAELLQVSLVTLNNWSKNKVLIPFSIGNRVYYRMQDILDSLKPINNNQNS